MPCKSRRTLLCTALVVLSMLWSVLPAQPTRERVGDSSGELSPSTGRGTAGAVDDKALIKKSRPQAQVFEKRRIRPLDPQRSPVRNVRIVTYNIQQLSDVAHNDNKYYDADGNPLTDIARVKIIADKLVASGAEIVAINEVFDEDSREAFLDALGGHFPHRVDYIGNDLDIEDSGLMLLSLHPFQPMELSNGHIYECGDVVISQDGDETECSTTSAGALLGFVEFDCDGSYGSNIAYEADCAASKGAGLVNIGLPNGESLLVVFSHFVANYGDDSEDLSCTKRKDRIKALRQISALITDAGEQLPTPEHAFPTFIPEESYIVVLGDLNIDGNASRALDSACQNEEWNKTFDPTGSRVRFMACGDRSKDSCDQDRRVMTDAWGFDTSAVDLGKTQGYDFTADPRNTEPWAVKQGKRLDYVLYRAPSPTVAEPRFRRLMVPQHLTIAWPISGANGELSDHLPLAVDLLLPVERSFSGHSTPRTARLVAVPDVGQAGPETMAITTAGQMQWLRIEGPSGSYSVQAGGGSLAMGFELYHPTDLSRPIKPRKVIVPSGVALAGTLPRFVYLLDDPPYYVRTFARLADRSHDRVSRGTYQVRVHRHRCTSPEEACILNAGHEGELVHWPTTPVNPEDSLWFEFEADSAADQLPFHEFSVGADFAPTALPAFDFAVVDSDTRATQNTLDWSTMAAEFNRRTVRASGIGGSGLATDPLRSAKTWLLKVTRPPDAQFSGQTRVSHATNLTYFFPLAIEVWQENDDSAHDELRIYMEMDGDAFYQNINQSNVHQHASKFHSLPLIEEAEDDGKPWPAKSLGVRRFALEMPLLMIEDDEEDGEDEPGDYLLANALNANFQMMGSGHALGTLPLYQEKAQTAWFWSDIDPRTEDANDSDYQYVLRFRMSHISPCRLWSDIPACDD